MTSQEFTNANIANIIQPKIGFYCDISQRCIMKNVAAKRYVVNATTRMYLGILIKGSHALEHVCNMISFSVCNFFCEKRKVVFDAMTTIVRIQVVEITFFEYMSQYPNEINFNRLR